MRSTGIAATGMSAQQINIDTIAHNVANSSTVGFHRSKATFNDMLYQTLSLPGSSTSTAGTILPTGINVGNGTMVTAIYKDFEPGSAMPEEGNHYSLMIEGDGFLQVSLPNGSTGYTRNGSLTMDNQGNIITLQGYQVLPGITIPANASKPTISYDGQVSVEINGIVTALGRIELAKFTNTPGLQPIGDTMYTSTSASGDPITGAPTEDGFGRIRQFFLENSNVNAITEMSNLIKAQRAFEFNSKVMHTSDAISQNIVQALA